MATFTPQARNPFGYYPPNAAPAPTPAPTPAPGAQTITASDGTVLDAGIVNLSRAIRQHESGGDYTKMGDADTSSGAYQFNNGKAALAKGQVPANFQTWASQYGLDPTDFSPVNQDKVAYARIKDLKDQGLTPEQVAAVWNGGMGVKDSWQNHKGTVVINGKNISYDTPAYVNTVMKNFQQIKGSDGSASPAADAAPALPVPPQAPIPAAPTGGAFGAIGDFIGGLAKSVTQPVATMLARPIQAGAELLGASPEQVNAASAQVPIFGVNGGLDVPQNAADVGKDVGRGVETVALGLGPVAGGGAFGFGNSLEQGNNLFSAQTALQTGAGLVGGKALDVAAPYIGKAAGAITPKFLKDTGAEAGSIVKPTADAVGAFMNNTKILPDAVSGAINKTADAVNGAPGAFGRAVGGQYGMGDVGGTPEQIRTATIPKVVQALGSTGNKSAGVFGDQGEKMLKGLETMHEMAPNLTVKDQFGEQIPYDPTTATLPQHVHALDQAKQQIYSQLESHLSSATKDGVQVDTQPAVDQLKAIINSPGKSLQHARAAALLEKVQGLHTPTQVNEFLQDLNAGLSGVFNGGSASIERRVDADLTSTLNNQLDKTVLDVGSGSKPIRDLKNQYSSLKSVEKGMVAKAQQLMRKVGGGLTDYINPFNVADALDIFTSPIGAAKAGLRAAMLAKAKLTRDPEQLLNGVFENIGKYKGTAPPRTVFGNPTPVKNAVVGSAIKTAFPTQPAAPTPGALPSIPSMMSGAFSPQSTVSPQ